MDTTQEDKFPEIEVDAPRMSEEINPRMLADTFAEDPDCAKQSKLAKPQASRSHLFAGARLDDELELKKLQVFVRIRPTITDATPRWGSENCIHASSKHSIAIAPPENSLAYKTGDRGQTYSFTRVFSDTTTQQEYFEGTAAPLIADLLRNPDHNSVMMAYGITAAGKTYTLEGNKNQPGVVPRALTELFDGLANHIEPLSVVVSYFEVYSEQLYDLLEDAPAAWPRERPQLKLKEDAKGRVFVGGLKEVVVESAEEALAVMRRGARQRQRAETGLNQGSSRSHSIFTIVLRKSTASSQHENDEDNHAESKPSDVVEKNINKDDGVEEGYEKLGRIAFVDLAGSERAQRTGNSGIRLKESVSINSSLMTLGRCLEALRHNQQNRGGALKVVPFRESKVTHLFRDALHGFGRVVLSVNVSPCAKDYDETTHVLRYAALATHIGTLQQAEAPRRTIKAVGPACYENHKRKLKEGKNGNAGAKRRKSQETRATQATEQTQQEEKADDEIVSSRQQQQQQPEEPSCQAVPEQNKQDDTSMIFQKENEEMQQNVSVVSKQAVSIRHEQDEQHDDLNDEEAVYDVVRGAVATFDDNDDLEDKALESSMKEEREGFDAVNEGEGSPMLSFGDDGATPMTPCDDDDDDDDEMDDAAVAELQAQVQDLIQQLQKAEERAVLLESEIREEVAEEMAHLLKDMEASYKERLAVELAGDATKDDGKNAKGASKAAGKKGGQRGRPNSADSNNTSEDPKDALNNAVVVNEALVQEVEALKSQLQKADQEAVELRQEIELHEEQSRAQAERVSKFEAALMEARASEAAAKQEVERLTNELTLQRTTHEQEMLVLREELGKASDRASSGNEADRFASCLKNQVAQLEANASMELEMAEQQLDRLRKDNVELQQKLGAAMAALAAISSPNGTTALQRVVAACPQGTGRGVGGTPHDVALARARMALAEQHQTAPDSAAHTMSTGGGLKMKTIGGVGFGNVSSGMMTGEKAKGSTKSRFATEALGSGTGGTSSPDDEVCNEEQKQQGLVVVEHEMEDVVHAASDEENLEMAAAGSVQEELKQDEDMVNAVQLHHAMEVIPEDEGVEEQLVQEVAPVENHEEEEAMDVAVPPITLQHGASPAVQEEEQAVVVEEEKKKPKRGRRAKKNAAPVVSASVEEPIAIIEEREEEVQLEEEEPETQIEEEKKVKRKGRGRPPKAKKQAIKSKKAPRDVSSKNAAAVDDEAVQDDEPMVEDTTMMIDAAKNTECITTLDNNNVEEEVAAEAEEVHQHEQDEDGQALPPVAKDEPSTEVIVEPNTQHDSVENTDANDQQQHLQPLLSEQKIPAAGRRRRLLQPSKPLTSKMRSALGDWEATDEFTMGLGKVLPGSTSSKGAKKQQQGGVEKGGRGQSRTVELKAGFSPNKKTRRQTQLHKLKNKA